MVLSFDVEGILYNYVKQITAGHLANAEVPVWVWYSACAAHKA